MTLTEIKSFLSERELRPLKRFGQNFLYDQNIAQSIVRWALEELPSDLPVLEIGPGLGAITEFFLAQNRHLTVIEIDKGLAQVLRDRFSSQPLFHLVEGDALKVELTPDLTPPILAGNLPYYISTPLLVRWLECPNPPSRMVFTLQREVAERLAAQPHQPAYGSLSVFVQVEYKVEYLRTLPPDVFYPRPDVDSAVARLNRIVSPFPSIHAAQQFREFVRKGFSQRRKKLSNTLAIPDQRRPEELSPQEWLACWQKYAPSHI